MKKLFLSFAIALSGSLSASAGEYAFLTFETADGERVSVAASGLSLAIEGDALRAGDRVFTLAGLKRMYFSNADMTTAVKAVTVAELGGCQEVFDLNGRRVDKALLTKGVYVVKKKDGTYKIAVK